MNKQRFSPPDGHVAAANRIIKLILIIIGVAILGVLGYESLTGAQPEFIQTVAIVCLVAIGMWLKENA